MKAPNHIVGGFTLTGTFASLFFGINILSSIPLLVVTGIGSLLPDIDHSQSLLGKLFYPIAKWINRRFGHRTLTHSVPIIVAIGMISGIIESFCSDNYHITITLCLAYFFHILLDMFTISGVKLMYPFQRDRIYVMIGRKDLRMRTGDFRAEAIAMFVFIIMGISLLPLMRNGFWTTYNSFFGKPQHLLNEFQQTNDLLEVQYTIKKGSETFKGSGYCVDASLSKIVLLENQQWRIITKKDYVIEKVLPVHTGKQYRFEAVNFLDISADSLNQLLQQHPVSQLQLTSNQTFSIVQNGITTTAKKYQEDYPQNLHFQAMENKIELDTFLPDQSHAPRVATIRQQIALLKAEQQQKNLHFQSQQQQLEHLRTNYQNADFTQKEKLIAEIKALEKLQPPGSNIAKITQLENQIQQIQSEAHIRNTSKKLAIELKNRELKKGVEETRFVGIATFVIIE